MTAVRLVRDLDECQEIWRGNVPVEFFTDLWEVRHVFQRHFRREPLFVVAEDEGSTGFLPLSWIDEQQWYGYFPGETWEGKTWLEKNRVVSGNGSGPAILLGSVPGRYHLR